MHSTLATNLLQVEWRNRRNHVVTLTGEVDSQTKRREAEKGAASVPNVQQVVSELQVKNQKATSSE